MGKLETMRKNSTVIISAVVDSTGEEVFQEMPLVHDADAPVADIISNAFSIFRKTGGVLVDVDDKTMMYYPITALRSTKFVYRAQAIVLPTAVAGKSFSVPRA